MHAEAQHADQDISHVVEKSHIHDDRSVATGERPTVPNKAHQEHDFVTELWGGTKARFMPQKNPGIYCLGCCLDRLV